MQSLPGHQAISQHSTLSKAHCWKHLSFTTQTPQVLHSVHRCLRWCLWSSVASRTWWLGTSSCIPFTHIYRHPMEMEHHGTESLSCLLCSGQVKLQSTGGWHYCLQWPQASTKVVNGKNTNNKVNRWSLELATYNIEFEWISIRGPQQGSWLPLTIGSVKVQNGMLSCSMGCHLSYNITQVLPL